jgi:hypothetical protein
MPQPWICWIVCTLIVGSILYELFTGSVRVRGIGTCPRDEKPSAYWLALGAKGALACLLAWMALTFSA